MRIALPLVCAAAIALGQSTDAIDDLDKRATAALLTIKRAETWTEVLGSRGAIRARLEQSLNLGRRLEDARCFGSVYLPKAVKPRMPAVVLVRPHSDLKARESRLLPATIAQMGVVVLEVDVHLRHSRLDLLAEGFVPQSLIQRDLRSAIGYLRSRGDVDMSRLGLIGQGLAATVGAAINPEFSAIVLLDGAPDFSLLLDKLRSLETPSGARFVRSTAGEPALRGDPRTAGARRTAASTSLGRGRRAA